MPRVTRPSSIMESDDESPIVSNNTSQDTPEMVGIRRQIDNVRSMLELNARERQTLREQRDRLERQFQGTPRNDMERKILAILARKFENAHITSRMNSTVISGEHAYEIYFHPVENNVILYRDMADQLWKLGFWADSVGVDFIFLRYK